MSARIPALPSVLAAFLTLAFGAGPAEAHRVSLSPAIGVYIPTAELVKAAEGEEFKQEVALSVASRLRLALHGPIRIELLPDAPVRAICR